MSLILEALKKAERQHRLGEVPGIGAQPGSAESTGLRGLGWLLLILMAGVMLGLGLYLGGFLFTGPQTTATLSPSAVVAPSAAVTPPAPISPPAPEPVTPLPVQPEPVAAEPPPVPEFRSPTPPPPAPPARPLSELPSGFVANLPSLNIDIHSYDRRAAKRYVLINMERYREGDYLAEGPQLIEILTDGVVLEHLGLRFILPIGNQ